MEEKEEYYTTNNVASIIKIISILNLILGIIICIVNAKYWENYTLIVIVVLVISSIFTYAIGEFIEIVHDIRTNSEHIRDYLEREKK